MIFFLKLTEGRKDNTCVIFYIGSNANDGKNGNV